MNLTTTDPMMSLMISRKKLVRFIIAIINMKRKSSHASIINECLKSLDELDEEIKLLS